MSADPRCVDDDGVQWQAIEAIAKKAKRALEGSEPPILTLEWIYELARMASVVWLKEAYELEAVQ